MYGLKPVPFKLKPVLFKMLDIVRGALDLSHPWHDETMPRMGHPHWIQTRHPKSKARHPKSNLMGQPEIALRGVRMPQKQNGIDLTVTLF
jgi:hypothetical protein